jgi:hypothetical protein
MNRRALSLAFVAVVNACSSPSADVDREPTAPNRPDVSSFGQRKIDDLSKDEAAALCHEDYRRTDLCMSAGIGLPTVAECESAVAECHAATTPSGNPQCDDFVAGGSHTCGIQAASYLECVDAWNEVYTCENAGRWIETPAECVDVIARCPRLTFAFSRTSGTPPECDLYTASRPPRTADDIYGCRPAPARVIVLGDSIADCSYVFDEAKCARTLITEHIRRYSPGVTMEEFSSPGTLFSQLPEQAKFVKGGPGHVFVWIHSIGNDLALRLIDYPGWQAAWEETVRYFTDTSRFPDGATFLLNTQFSPDDQCPNPVTGNPSLSMEEEATLQEVNRRVFLDVAESRPDTVAIDQYPDWLGHGSNANLRGCPHCGADNTPWLSGSHPNEVGNAHIAAKWIVALDRMLGGACAE